MKDFITRFKAAILLILFGGGAYFGSTALNQRREFEEIGTSSSPVTLTNTFTGAGAVSSTAINVKGLNAGTIAGTWTTKSHGAILYVKLQRSLDNGSTYFDYSLQGNLKPWGDSMIGLNNVDFLKTSSTIHAVGATSTSGIPWVIGDRNTASGTTISFSFPINDYAVSDYVKIYFQESTTATHGTLHSQSMFSN